MGTFGIVDSCSSEWVLEAAMQASPGSAIEMQNLRHPPPDLSSLSLSYSKTPSDLCAHSCMRSAVWGHFLCCQNNKVVASTLQNDSLS